MHFTGNGESREDEEEKKSLSFATQHSVFQKLRGTWGTEYFNTLHNVLTQFLKSSLVIRLRI